MKKRKLAYELVTDISKEMLEEDMAVYFEFLNETIMRQRLEAGCLWKFRKAYVIDGEDAFNSDVFISYLSNAQYKNVCIMQKRMMYY